MTEYDALLSTLAITMGVGWASGLNLYAAILVLGFFGMTGDIGLPPSLEALQSPLVIAAAGFMYFIEFFVDKTPGVDTGWDAIHSFIRIPAGAMLAATTVGDVSPAMQVAAGLLGGSLAGVSHATKAGSRILINTSPEPFTNWTASVSEDVVVLGSLWAALNYPIVFIVALIITLCILAWLLPKIWRGIKFVYYKIKGVFSKNTPSQEEFQAELAAHTTLPKQ